MVWMKLELNKDHGYGTYSRIQKKIKLSLEKNGKMPRKGLDLLGTKYQEVTKPFKGKSGVTHPLLANLRSVTQFQAQAYKELSTM